MCDFWVTFELTEDLLALKSLHEWTSGEHLVKHAKTWTYRQHPQLSPSLLMAHPQQLKNTRVLLLKCKKISPDTVFSLYCAPATTMQQFSWWITHEGYGHFGQGGQLHSSTPTNASPVFCIVGRIGWWLLRPCSAVRWLSQGKVLHLFLAVLPEIVHFLDDFGEGDRFPVLRDKEWKTNLAFLADITVHLSKLYPATSRWWKTC